MSLRVVPKQRALAFGITLVLLAGLSCDRVTAPPTTGGIELGLSRESVVALDGVRITVSGPATKTVTSGPQAGGAISVSMADLPPGTYTLTAAGLVGGRVAQYGETSGVTIRAGNNSSAHVALSGFQPVVSALSDTVKVLHFNVTYAAVPHATSYVVEWSKSPTMTDAASTVVTGTSVDVSVAEEGQYYFAVRAANATVAEDGLPTLPHPVFVMQVVSSVTVLPLSPSIVDGATQQFTATARDQDNNVIANPTLYWASSNHGAATTNQNGLVTTVGPGQATITAVSKGTPGSATLTVTPQPASKLVFTTPPSNTTAGQSITAIKVAIQNPKNEVASSDNTTQVTLAIAANPGSGALSGTATATVVDGVATFSNLSINKSGTGYTLLATTGGAVSNATSGTFNIVPDVATQLAFVVQPTTATAGVAISPAMQIEVRDALGNRVTSARDPVTIEFVSNPGAGTLSGSTVVNAIDGIASFSGISVDKAGSGYTVRATSGSLANSPASSGFTIGAAAAAVLSFSTQPTTTSTDDMISAQVVVKDRFGNLVSSAPPVTLTLGAGADNATLTGTTTQPVVAGLATFGDLRLDVVEQGYVLVAQSGSLISATSNAFDMTVGAPAKLGFTVQPTDAEPQGPLNTVRVAILDASGNQTSVAEDVTLALTNPGGATLSGTLTVTSANGVAEFSDLSVDVTGTGYQLSATASVAGATSDAFVVALDFVETHTGDLNSCGLTVNGNAYCWGYGGVGGTGEGVNTVTVTSPVRVVGGHTFSTIATGWAHSCGLRSSDGAAYCWGYNFYGQLGDGVGTASTPTPVAVSGGQTFVAISAGALHTCALDEAGLAWCWGNQDFGRLGNNNTFAGNVISPVAVFGSLVFSSISAGLEHTCAIQASNLAAYCWGRQANGRLGNNSVVDVGIGTPQPVQGGLAFLSVTAGLHTCGVVAPDTDRRGFCWGTNANGQLGVATSDFADKSVPTVVANSLRFANLDAGYLHTCGATVGGSGFCWGLATDGRLGNGEVAGNRETPRQILGAFSFTKVHAAKAGDSFQSAHSCAMTTKGAYCWGDNLFGYLGDGSTLLTSTPVRVRGQR